MRHFIVEVRVVYEIREECKCNVCVVPKYSVILGIFYSQKQCLCLCPCHSVKAE